MTKIRFLSAAALLCIIFLAPTGIKAQFSGGTGIPTVRIATETGNMVTKMIKV